MWWGGAFERMVQSTKRCLKKLMGRAHFSLDELTTALAEIEAVLNSRPLSYVPGDMEKPISPSHLVVGRRILNLPDNYNYLCDLDDDEFELNEDKVRRRVRHFNNVLNHFWSRWQTEYLNNLREVHARAPRQPPSSGSYISVGDVVIVKDEQLPRGQWKLAIVRELFQGKDGKTRAAAVKVASGGVLNRPVQLLFPLEIQCASEETYLVDNPDPNPESEVNSTELNESNVPQARPRRTAAKNADAIRRACMEDEYDED